MNSENNTIKLLTWMATNRDPRFLENVIYALEKKTGKKVDTVYYLHGGPEKDQKEIFKIRDEVKAFFEKKLNFETINVGVFNSSNHDEVMTHLITALEPRLNTLGDICINISSGTPTMSTVWMFLKILNYFRDRATFYDAPKYRPSIHRSNDVVPKEDQKIYPFNYSSAFNTMVGIRTANRQKVGLKDTFLGTNSRVRLRQDAQEKIKLYSKIDNVPMLILGERGVGKSATVKQLIKDIKKKEVIEAVCGAMDSNLADSMLFGHVKGAFSGAVKNHDGLFKQAEKKILFLDEVQDLPKSTQRKLLRTIQEKDHPYCPLGSETEEKANVQFIFASNNTMEQLYEKLDPDFLDRIKMFSVRIPSLKECKADILDDWNAVWGSCKSQGNKIIPEEAPWNDDLQAFFDDDINLEGNIRSLQKVAYQIIAWEAWDKPDRIKEILKELRQENIETYRCLHKKGEKNESMDRGNSINDNVFPFEQEIKALGLDYNWKNAVHMFKKKLAEQAVEHCGNSIPKAWKMLNCNKNTISDALDMKFKP